jgi:glycosyltransferase involved in cell wall biosynthesis
MSSNSAASHLRFSVVVPAFNEEKLIVACLTSLVSQDPPPDEIIVSDNASTDQTAALVAQFISQHPAINIHMVFETRRGCVFARDRGWRAATGNFVIHVDADETFPPGWLQKIRRALADHPEIDAIGGTVRFEDPPPVIVILQALFNLLYPRLVRLFRGFPYLCGGMTICRREILERIDGYAHMPANQLDDYYLSEQAHKLGYRLRYMPSIYAIHSLRRYHAGGLRAFLKWGAAGLDAKHYEP